MNIEALYTARWHINAGQPIPAGAPTEAALEAVTAALGVPAPAKATPPQQVTGIAAPGMGIGIGSPPLILSRDKWLVPTGKMPIIGRALQADEFAAYLEWLGSTGEKWLWTPKGITIHHTAAPDLESRPKGFTEQHMLNLRSYYAGDLGWSSGPHFFTDEDQVWLFSPIWGRGVHAKSFNATHLGIEMLGDYDDEDPWSGRGLAVLTTTAQWVAALCHHFHWDPARDVNFHRDDRKTSKTCPGTKITKEKFLALVRQYHPAR